jgi:hypothetical protein
MGGRSEGGLKGGGRAVDLLKTVMDLRRLKKNQVEGQGMLTFKS